MQGSPKWLDMRMSYVTASEIAEALGYIFDRNTRIFGCYQYKKRFLDGKSKIRSKFVETIMARGSACEPYAIDDYLSATLPHMQPHHHVYGKLFLRFNVDIAASPDLLFLDELEPNNSFVLEVKCPVSVLQRSHHLIANTYQLPVSYILQLITNMFAAKVNKGILWIWTRYVARAYHFEMSPELVKFFMEQVVPTVHSVRLVQKKEIPVDEMPDYIDPKFNTHSDLREYLSQFQTHTVLHNTCATHFPSFGKAGYT